MRLATGSRQSRRTDAAPGSTGKYRGRADGFRLPLKKKESIFVWLRGAGALMRRLEARLLGSLEVLDVFSGWQPKTVRPAVPERMVGGESLELPTFWV
jgi:hypothetical protein